MKKNILLVVILVVIMASFVACKKTEAVEPVASEEVSSSEEVSEEVSEEPSEEVSEEISEEASEEVVEIDLSKYSVSKGKSPADLAEEMNYKELRVVVWNANKGASAILANGDSYVAEEADTYMLVFAKTVKDVKITNGEIRTQKEKFYSFSTYSAEDAYDVTCEVTYEDGTTETITVNITVFK